VIYRSLVYPYTIVTRGPHIQKNSLFVTHTRSHTGVYGEKCVHETLSFPILQSMETRWYALLPKINGCKIGHQINVLLVITTILFNNFSTNRSWKQT